MNDVDLEEYNSNILQELDAAEEEGESALSLFLHDLIEIDIESNFTFNYTVIERILNICSNSLENHLIVLSNECIYFLCYCINKCINIKEVGECFFKDLNNIISFCLNERSYSNGAFLLFERTFFFFVQDVNNVENFIDVWNGHSEYLNSFVKTLLQIIAFHLCLLNETVFYLKYNTSSSKQRQKRNSTEQNSLINKTDSGNLPQHASTEGNTRVGAITPTQTVNATKCEISESNLSFIQKGYSRIKIIEVSSDLFIYFFENSGEIRNIEAYEDYVNIILKEYENVPDIEIKKKILLLFKSIKNYVNENELTEFPFIISINSLIKKKKNYYLTLTKEKNISISHLKEQSYVYINNSVLSIQTSNNALNRNNGPCEEPEGTIILTPVGCRGSLLINIFYVYFYNTKNELLMVLSYDRIHFKHNEINQRKITLQFNRNDATGVLSNRLKEKLEDHFMENIDISISFSSVETKTRVLDTLNSIVRIENAKVDVEDIVEEDTNTEVKEVFLPSENILNTECDIREFPLSKKIKEKDTVMEKEEEEEEFKEEEKMKLIKEKLQKRKVSFATTKEIRLLNDNESVASKTIPLEESINNFNCSVSDYLYNNNSIKNAFSESDVTIDQSNMHDEKIKSITSSILKEKILKHKYYGHEYQNSGSYLFYKYDNLENQLESNNENQPVYVIKNNCNEAKTNDNLSRDLMDDEMDPVLCAVEKEEVLIHYPYQRKCQSEQDGYDYKKLHELYQSGDTKNGIVSEFKPPQTHICKDVDDEAEEINGESRHMISVENDIELNIMQKKHMGIYSKQNEENIGNQEIINEKEYLISSQEELSKNGENSSISAAEIVSELLGLNHKQKNINECIRSLSKRPKDNENKQNAQNTVTLKNKAIKEGMINNENDKIRRSKRVMAQKKGYSFEVLQMEECQKNSEKEKTKIEKGKNEREYIEKGENEKKENTQGNLKKKNFEVSNETKTKALKDISELILIVGKDEPSNEPIIRHDNKNDKEKFSEKKEASATAPSSIDRKSLISSGNKKRVSTHLTTDAEDYYSKNNIDSPYPLKKIKQNNYDASFLDFLKGEDNIENLSAKYLIKAYTLIQYNRRYVHIQIVDYFRQIKKNIILTHQEINTKYNNLLINLQNEYEQKFENIIAKFSHRLISKKKKLNTNTPQILDLKIIQHKINALKETLKIVQNTVKDKFENSKILLKYKESDYYTPTFSLATILSKYSP